MAKNTGTTAETSKPIDTSNWEKEQIGFDPYFVIKEDAEFVASFVGRDDTAKNFIRYQFMASQDMVCQRGPNDEGNARHEKVSIKQGETFNVSSFFSLAKLLDEYLSYSADTGKAVLMNVKCTGSTKTEAGNKVWLWEVKVPSAVKAALNTWRLQHAPARLKAGQEARAQLES